MQHYFGNQELARLRYANAIRNSRTDRRAVDEPKERIGRSRSLLSRVGQAVGDALSPVPEPRPTT